MKYQVFVCKEKGFDVEAKGLEKNFSEAIDNFSKACEFGETKIVNHYLIDCSEEIDIKYYATKVLAEENVDDSYVGDFDFSEYSLVLPIRCLPAQYDQRADFAEQVLQSMDSVSNISVRTSKIYCFKGNFTDELRNEIISEILNPVESMLVDVENLEFIKSFQESSFELKGIDELMNLSEVGYEDFISEYSLAMSKDDLEYIVKYFKSENRQPNLLEIKALDTYWSDHCRHSTFSTCLKNVKIESEGVIKDSIDEYFKIRKELGREKKPVSLMDMATINAKYHIYKNKNHNIDVSEEINACSINVECAMEDGSKVDTLLMFKNETHNHPTEIEPYGGAATCLGGAIRDPLSGRAYVYGAMRISGAADPTAPKKDTLEGKLPQYRICREAAKGYSSYGNQIGLATGLVREYYHPGFLAKRFELGAVIASTPKDEVKREEPKAGDIVLLLGGRTGRDGVGGATGSSKSHNEDSLMSSGGEVQKGNPPNERKLQRLFMNSEISKMIKRCNDFGAGGVSVAVGEIADSIDIDLDAVPKKYAGLSALETALSESQERMAVVIEAQNFDKFKQVSDIENVECTKIADVTDSGRLIMRSGGKIVLDFARNFLDSGGAIGEQAIDLNRNTYDEQMLSEYFSTITSEYLEADLNIELTKLINSSQKGLIENFDSTIGTTTVSYPLGGKNRISLSDVMINRIPVSGKISKTMSGMSAAYDPYLAEISQYHAGYYAVVLSVASLVAAGFSHKNIKLSLQEYFEKLHKDPVKWTKPFLAILGAMKAQILFDSPAIGGKDSMSGSFKDIDVPPSIVSFAVSNTDDDVLNNLFENSSSKVYILEAKLGDAYIIDFDNLDKKYSEFNENKSRILAAKAVNNKGVFVNLFEMAAGNAVDISLDKKTLVNLPKLSYGSIIFQTKDEKLADSLGAIRIAEIKEKELCQCENMEGFFGVGEKNYGYCDLINSYMQKLSHVYPIYAKEDGCCENINFSTENKFSASLKVDKPKVFIPVFPGTNCEIDTARAFERAGAEANVVIFRNQNDSELNDTIIRFERAIKEAQILAIPGGFSAGDEPEGSAKFITAVFRNPRLKDAINELLLNRDGLAIGICNGFQALIKLGIFDKGMIGEIDENSPTLTYNKIGRHISEILKIRIASNNSPWLSHAKVGDVYNVAVSHGEGRFVCNDDMLTTLIKNSQVATQYADNKGNASMDPVFNPNSSINAVEGLISKDGRVFGKMGHSERYLDGLYQNVDGKFDENIFKSGVNYFRIK